MLKVGRKEKTLTFYCKIRGISENKEKFHKKRIGEKLKGKIIMRVNTLNVGFWLIFGIYEMLANGILSDAFFGILAQFGRAGEFLEFISGIFDIIRFPMNLMGKFITGREFS